MKKYLRILIFTSIIICQLSLKFMFAQAPQAIPYQGVARNTAGEIISNQLISLRIGLHQGSAVGPWVYGELQSTTTSSLGLFNINIGEGTPFGSAAPFAGINWGTGTKFIRVQMDVTGGSNYIDMGTTQLMSVPYALYAEKVSSNYMDLSTNQIANGNKSFSNDIIVNELTIGNGSGNSLLNTVTGFKALHSNTTGVSNTAFGLNSLYSNTEAHNNTGIGALSLYSNTTGPGNTGTGWWTLYSNTTGSGNTAFGTAALKDNISGDGNTAVGYGALVANITGIYNTGIGSGANVNDGLYNATAIGYSALAEESNSIQLGNLEVTSVKTEGKLISKGMINRGSNTVNTFVTDQDRGITVNDHCVIFTGSNASKVFVLPAANTSLGRVLLIVNQSDQTLNISTYLSGVGGASFTTILAGQNVQLISDGASWRKIN